MSDAAERIRGYEHFYAAVLAGEYGGSAVVDHAKVVATLRALLAERDALLADKARLEQGARGAIQTAAMMLAKLGGSATFTALEHVALHGRVTRTEGPMGEFTLSFDAARTHTQEGE